MPDTDAIAFEVNGFQYEGILLPIDEGEDLYWEVTASLIEPIAAIIGGSGLQSLMLAMEGDPAASVDLRAAAGALGTSLRGTDMRRLTDRLVIGSRLQRSKDDASWDLSNKIDRNKAYRANYTEKVMACIQIMRLNGFFPQLGS